MRRRTRRARTADPTRAVPTGTTAPVFTFDAPPGSFFVRLHSQAGVEESAASNEVPLHVGELLPPSAPERLLGLTNGSEVALAWRNSYVGGAPSGIVLDVSGSIAASIPLGLTFSPRYPTAPTRSPCAPSTLTAPVGTPMP